MSKEKEAGTCKAGPRDADLALAQAMRRAARAEINLWARRSSGAEDIDELEAQWDKAIVKDIRAARALGSDSK